MSRLAWNSVTITCLNVLTLLAGLVLYPFIAARFEARVTDGFFLALTIPWLIIGPVMNAVSSTLIPVLAEARHRQSDALGKVVGSAITYGVALSAVAAGVVGALTPLGLTLAGSSLTDEAVDRVVANTFLLLPLIVLQTITSVLDAASNAAGCFWLPAGATLVRQLATFAGIALLQAAFGDLSLAAGFTVGAAAHLVVLRIFWRHAKTEVTLGRRIPSELRTALRLAVPLVIGSAALQVGVLLSRFVAAGLGPGSVTALDYAYRVSNAVVEVTSSGVLLVILADWSAAVVNGSSDVLRAKLRNVMRLVLFTLLPLVFVLHALRSQLLTLWLGSSGVSVAFIALTAATLGFLLIGLPLDIAGRVYARVFLVRRNTRILAGLAIGRLVLSGALFFPLAAYLGVPGIALADAIGILFVLAGLSLAARRQLGGPVTGLAGSLLRLTAAAAGGWVAASAIAIVLGTFPLVPLVAVVGITSVIVYILLAWMLGSHEFRTLWEIAFAWRAGRVPSLRPDP
jgi:putative peptidoglycan lipid II flippase